ncbi:protein takeout-like [Vanessa atalanta]|uniref:protein takeout-like n=1 Tax=Vanessa atalanta TaxID=42275 RepID=UPI001FCD6A2F|nr:protein takeout-like [Vanessa atalanta]
MFITLFFTIFCLSTGILSSSLPPGFTLPCDISDESCINKFANILLPHLFTGIQDLEIPSVDPLYIDKVIGDISILKYTFYNSTIVGFKKCKVSNLKLDKEFTKLSYDLICPHLIMTGIYDITGRLVLLPVEGNGDFKMTSGKYFIHVESELKTTKGKTDKIHAHIKNFKLKCEPQEPLYFDFKNLFNGQKDLSDTVHKFANENWQEVANQVQDPLFYAIMKRIVTISNKYLKHVPLEDILRM